jgi:transposase-like protein
MATKLTSCPICKSYSINELNPERRAESTQITTRVKCECNECSEKFEITTWTVFGKRKGVWY